MDAKERAVFEMTFREAMSLEPPVESLKIPRVSDRALGIAFNRLRATLAPEVVNEPGWGPEEGFAKLRKKEYRIHLHYTHSDSELYVQCFGSIAEEEWKAILGALREPPLPPNLK